jgi:hypothetical protein
MGYARAGFEVVGVDIEPQPNYPFEFHRGDAVEFIKAHGHEFDAIHASPPCQAATPLTTGTNARKNQRQGIRHPQLIPATREALEKVGRPYVIENVAGAPIRKDLRLCGEMFGLGVLRHRFFECGGWTPIQIPHRPHRGRVSGCRHGEWHTGPYVAVYGEGGGKGSVAQWQQAMGIDWTDVRREIAEAIPPAFTEHIGRQLMAHLFPSVPSEAGDQYTLDSLLEVR